jgi:hypothetical protein
MDHEHEFNEYLDDKYDKVLIEGIEFWPSVILQRICAVSYYDALDRYMVSMYEMCTDEHGDIIYTPRS